MPPEFSIEDVSSIKLWSRRFLSTYFLFRQHSKSIRGFLNIYFPTYITHTLMQQYQIMYSSALITIVGLTYHILYRETYAMEVWYTITSISFSAHRVCIAFSKKERKNSGQQLSGATVVPDGCKNNPWSTCLYFSVYNVSLFQCLQCFPNIMLSVRKTVMKKRWQLRMNARIP